MNFISTVAALLGQFGLRHAAAEIIPLENSDGLSGAMLWKIIPATAFSSAGPGPFCLRRWPKEHPAPDRLAWIHAVLKHVQQQTKLPLPVPLATLTGETFIRAEGHLWELTPWLIGAADFAENHSPARTTAALQAVAQFHVAGSQFSRHQQGEKFAPSQVVEDRFKQMQDWKDRKAFVLQAKAADAPLQIRSFAEPILGHFWRLVPHLLPPLQIAAHLPVPWLPAIRDLRPEHLLFTGEQLTGILDFGALRWESPMLDLARLLSGCQQPTSEWVAAALASYHEVRPLDDSELHLLEPLLASVTLMSALTLLDWLILEQKPFSHPQLLIRRLAVLLRQLESA